MIGRKLQFRENYERFKKEYRHTFSLLNDLISLNEKTSRDIDNVDESWLFSHKQYLLEVNNLQYVLYHKLLSINLDLEFFHSRILTDKIPDLKDYKCLTDPSVTCNECKDNYIKPLKTPVQSLVSTRNSTNKTLHNLENYKRYPSNNIKTSSRRKQSRSPSTYNSNLYDRCSDVELNDPASMSIETLKKYVERMQSRMETLRKLEELERQFSEKHLHAFERLNRDNSVGELDDDSWAAETNNNEKNEKYNYIKEPVTAVEQFCNIYSKPRPSPKCNIIDNRSKVLHLSSSDEENMAFEDVGNEKMCPANSPKEKVLYGCPKDINREPKRPANKPPLVYLPADDVRVGLPPIIYSPADDVADGLPPGIRVPIGYSPDEDLRPPPGYSPENDTCDGLPPCVRPPPVIDFSLCTSSHYMTSHVPSSATHTTSPSQSPRSHYRSPSSSHASPSPSRACTSSPPASPPLPRAPPSSSLPPPSAPPVIVPPKLIAKETTKFTVCKKPYNANNIASSANDSGKKELEAALRESSRIQSQKREKCDTDETKHKRILNKSAPPVVKNKKEVTLNEPAPPKEHKEENKELFKVKRSEIKSVCSNSRNMNDKSNSQMLGKKDREKSKSDDSVDKTGFKTSSNSDEKLAKSKRSKSDSFLRDQELFDSYTFRPTFKRRRILEDVHIPKEGDLCMILHIDTPDHFYIQLGDEDTSQCDLMEQTLNYFYSKSLPLFTSKSEARVSLGQYCAAYVDELQGYFRAEILDWLINEKDTVLITLVDYGKQVLIHYNNIRLLEDSFYTFPKTAQKCHLECLYPPGSTTDNRLTEWPIESTQAFIQAVGDTSNIIFEIYFVNKDHSRNSLGIDFIKHNSEGDVVSIGQMLIDKGHAVEIIDEGALVCADRFMKEQIKTAQGLSDITMNMTKEEVLDKYFENNKIVEPYNVNEAVMHYNPRDEAKTCPFQKNGACFKGSRCKLRHVPLPKDGFTADKQPVYSRAFNDMELPAPGNTVTVMISCIMSIQRFYVQLIKNAEIECSVAAKEFSLSALRKQMNDPNIIKNYKRFRYPPSLGEIVIAKHNWDGSWYRAKVCEILDNLKGSYKLEVFVVDFGETIEVTLDNVRKIEPEFLELPFQAVECYFYNIQHKADMDADIEKSYFEDKYIYQNVMARIIENPGHLEVLLFDDKGNDIGTKLVEAGFGEFKTDFFFPSQKNGLLID